MLKKANVTEMRLQRNGTEIESQDTKRLIGSVEWGLRPVTALSWRSEAEKLASLFAAAPEMLAMLEEMEAFARREMAALGITEPSTRLKKLRTLISQAKGETTC